MIPYENDFGNDLAQRLKKTGKKFSRKIVKTYKKTKFSNTTCKLVTLLMLPIFLELYII